MEGLHIEMAFLSVLGQWLDGSGWTKIMLQAKVVTEGRVLGVEKGSSTSRGQWAHQITLAALSILKRGAYNQYSSLHCESNNVIIFKVGGGNGKQAATILFLEHVYKTRELTDEISSFPT